MKFKSLFKSIDSFIFEKIPSIKANSIYESIQDFLESLNDEKKEFISKAISLCILLLPLIIMLFFILGYSQSMGELKMKKDIYQKVTSLISEQKQLSQNQRKSISSSSPKTKSALESKVKYLLGRKGINSHNVKIQDFKTESLSGSIQKNEATLLFNDLNPRDLISFITDLLHQEKVKITSIDVQQKNNKLEGKLPIIYLSSGN